MLKTDIVNRGSKNVIFTAMQDTYAWDLKSKDVGPDPFYERNLNDLISYQKKYAEAVGADYRYYHGDLVSFVKEKLPGIIDLRLFIQYYDFARYIIMHELSLAYDKILYIDSDIVPITKKSIFDEITEQDSFYTHWFYLETCPFFDEMQTYLKFLKPKNFIYKGHTNCGVLAARGVAIKKMFDTSFDKMMEFFKTIDSNYEPEHVIYVGFEHLFMYLKGTDQINFNLRNFNEQNRWNVYAMKGFCDPLEDILIKLKKNKKHEGFLHFCGGEAKKWYEEQKDNINELIKETFGE